MWYLAMSNSDVHVSVTGLRTAGTRSAGVYTISDFTLVQESSKDGDDTHTYKEKDKFTE